MATQTAFIDDLIKNGATDDEIAEAVKIGQQKGLIDNGTPAAPETPSLSETVAPRSANSAHSDISLSQVPGQVIKNLEDMASMPGRAFVGLSHGAGALMQGKGLSGAYNEAKTNMANPQADPTAAFPQRFVENAIKDWATVATLPIGPEAGFVAKGLRGLAQAAKTGLKQGVVSAGVHQTDRLASGQGVDLGQAAVEVGGSAALGMGGKVLSGIEGNSLKDAAARVQGTKVKINSPEYKKGAENEMYTKHEVFGGAKNVREQWQDKIEKTSAQVKERIQNQPDVPENYTSIDDIFNAADAAAVKYGKNRTDIIAEKKAIAELRAHYEEAYPEGTMSLLDAQAEKQAAGHKGDWYTIAGEVKTDPALSSTGKAYNAVYDALKSTVENKGAPGIRELNKQLSEFIPMERAARKQVLVNSRKNLIPLDTFIGAIHTATSAVHGNVLPALITAATLGTRSPVVAKTLNTAGNFMQKNPVASKIGSAAQASTTELAGRGLSQAARSNIAPPTKPPRTYKRLEQEDPLSLIGAR